MTYRTELAELLPWVRRYRRRRRCDAYRSMSRKAHEDPVRRETYRCDAPAWWRFTALDRSWANTGSYCWSHLVSRGVYCDQLEIQRFEKWCDRHLGEITTLGVKHGRVTRMGGRKNDRNDKDT